MSNLAPPGFDLFSSSQVYTTAVFHAIWFYKKYKLLFFNTFIFYVFNFLKWELITPAHNNLFPSLVDVQFFFFVFIIYLKTIRCRCTAFVLPYPKLFYSANFSKYLLNILSKEIYGILKTRTSSSLYSTHVRKFDLLLIFQPITAQLCSCFRALM